MTGWRGALLRVLRVPPEPAAPPGEGTRVFRAGRNYFRYKLASWLIAQLAAVAGLLFAFWFASNVRIPGVPERLLVAIETLGAIGFVAQVPFSLLVTVLDFEMRWYIVTDRSLRIREGITSVREKTMTFANIQNIVVRQGPLQRLLGIADVEVRNAGGGATDEHAKESGGGDPVHVGYFRGVEDADAIRDLLLEGVRRQRDAGLGDPDDRMHATARRGDGGSPDLAGAAALLLAEAKALRAAMSARQGR
jgi:membrane protein YdbS with pleckstrin-like domain